MSTSTMIIAGIGFVVAMYLMRRTAAGARRDRPDGIRWRGIDWSRVEQPQQPEDEDHLRKSQD